MVPPLPGACNAAACRTPTLATQLPLAIAAGGWMRTNEHTNEPTNKHDGSRLLTLVNNKTQQHTLA